MFNVLSAYIGLSDVPAFRVLRTLRGLRPLRAMSRMESMRVSEENCLFATKTNKEAVIGDVATNIVNPFNGQKVWKLARDDIGDHLQ